MNRAGLLRLIAVALAVYGVYIAGYIPGMLVGPPAPVLLLGFVLQAACALVAAVGVWRGERWAAGVLVLLGVSIAGTWLFEGFVLGIVAYLRALFMALAGVVLTILIAAYIGRPSVVLRH